MPTDSRKACASREIQPLGLRPWSPRSALAPKVSGSADTTLVVESNGSPGCYGGWEVIYPAGADQDCFFFSIDVRFRDLRHGRKSFTVETLWVDAHDRQIDWAPVYRESQRTDGWETLAGRLAHPSGGAEKLVVRLILQWSARGQVEWRSPMLTPAEPEPPRRIRLGAACSPPPRDARLTWEMNRDRFLRVCRRAGGLGIQLLCLPEVALTDGVRSSEGAEPHPYVFAIPGPEIQPFQDVARECAMAICLCLLEREGELLYNAAVLIDEDGRIADKYRKVHLALPMEAWSGITAGEAFSVASIRTADARVGMNICMDSSAAESARSVAALGGEILLLPIMGDVRADGLGRGRPQFDLERWEMIQRMRALDNHLYVVAARNTGLGTGIFGPDGNTLAVNRGDCPLVWADVDLSHRTKSWTGISFYDTLWYQQRPFAYTLEP